MKIHTSVFLTMFPCASWSRLFTVINGVDDNFFSSASHATRTPEYIGSKTTVSKLHFARLAAIIDFFFFSLWPVCFVSAPTLTKATVYFISLATKACDQSFIIYDTANGLGPIKKKIFALHKVLAGPADNRPINFVVVHTHRPLIRGKLCLCVTVEHRAERAEMML